MTEPSASAPPLSLIARRPWLLVVAAFLVLFTAWFFFIRIALKNKPAEAPIPTRMPAHNPPPEGGRNGQP